MVRSYMRCSAKHKHEREEVRPAFRLSWNGPEAGVGDAGEIQGRALRMQGVERQAVGGCPPQELLLGVRPHGRRSLPDSGLGRPKITSTPMTALPRPVTSARAHVAVSSYLMTIVTAAQAAARAITVILRRVIGE